MDKRLTVNPLSYRGIRRFPPEKTVHGYRVRGYKNPVTEQWTPDSRPEWCRLGNSLITNEKGKQELIKSPCFACLMTMQTRTNKQVNRRKRVNSRDLIRAFFRP